MVNVVIVDKEQIVLNADAMRIRELVMNKELSVVEVTKVLIDHIKKTNIELNYLVEDRFETALEEAENADRAIAEGNADGKLFGVPMSIKESFDVAGLQTTGGLKRRKGFVQTKDAEVVSKLRAEGAIILGKTNTPELCFCQETDNKLYGRTNNPHNVNRTVGGSSGGEGAIIAVGGAAAGLGSDIGGSIRFPSHFNGIVGFKPGNNQVSQIGSYPFVGDPFQQRMLGIGPMTKSVRDAKYLYSIISQEPVVKKDIDQFTINVFRTTQYPLSDETTLLLNNVYLHMKETLKTEREPIPYFDESALLWQEIMSIDGGEGTIVEAFGNRRGNVYREYSKELLNGRSDIHRYLSWALIGASLFKPSKKRIREIGEILKKGDAKVSAYLDNRIVIMPVYHKTAPPHGEVYQEIFSIKKTFLKYMPYVAYANTWGLPSLTVPVGKDKDGMPIGLQIIGKNGNEDALFTVGSIIEKEFGGYVRAKIN